MFDSDVILMDGIWLNILPIAGIDGFKNIKYFIFIITFFQVQFYWNIFATYLLFPTYLQFIFILNDSYKTGPLCVWRGHKTKDTVQCSVNEDCTHDVSERFSFALQRNSVVIDVRDFEFFFFFWNIGCIGETKSIIRFVSWHIVHTVDV